MTKFINRDLSFISNEAKLGKDITIYPNVHIEGLCIIGDNVTLYPGTFIKDSIIGNDCNIRESQVFDSCICDGCEIGPYTSVHSNTKIGFNNRIGSFVEVKNSIIGDNNKILHHAYIGDTIIEANVNIGAGVITANYNGKTKNKTIVHSNSFIGCNTNLIAPIEIGENSFIAAGSTITNNLKKNTFTIPKRKQINKKRKHCKK